MFRVRMEMRDENDVIMEGKHIDVAVKQPTVHRSRANVQLPQFMREEFLQKSAQHPCIIRSLAGYWPDPDEDEEEEEIAPLIIVERMTCNLMPVQDRKLLEPLESKRSAVK